MSSVTLYSPNDPEASQAFELDSFMGKWHITHSTLPLWKGKTDVSITYTPIPNTPPSNPHTFLDSVSYKKPSSSTPSTVLGIDTEQEHPASFKWRGKGWLIIASTRWQLIGYNPGPGKTESDEKGDPAWAVSLFEKTLFTPAGLDIYARTPEGLPQALLEQIISKVKELGGEVASMADGFFEIPRTVTPGKITIEI